MTTTIDKAKTGQQIRLLMEKRGVTVRDVKNALSLACVQSVYHWLDGQSMPTLDNLYALSDLLKVPMDMLVCGNRRYDPKKDIPEGAQRLFRYYRLIQNAWQPETVRLIQKDLSPARRRSAVSRVLLLEECLCQEEEVKNDAADDFRKGIL